MKCYYTAARSLSCQSKEGWSPGSCDHSSPLWENGAQTWVLLSYTQTHLSPSVCGWSMCVKACDARCFDSRQMEGSLLIIGQMCGHKQRDAHRVSSFSKYQTEKKRRITWRDNRTPEINFKKLRQAGRRQPGSPTERTSQHENFNKWWDISPETTPLSGKPYLFRIPLMHSSTFNYIKHFLSVPPETLLICFTVTSWNWRIKTLTWRSVWSS